MDDFLAWVLSVFGLTYIIIFSKITKPVRDFADRISEWLGDLFHCPLCLGFWVGLLGSLCMYSPTYFFLFDGALGAIVAWVGTLSISKMQRDYENGGCSKCKEHQSEQYVFQQGR